MTLIIHAPNIHQGGGKTLLTELLTNVGSSSEVICILDQRLIEKLINPPMNSLSVNPSIANRFSAEIKLRQITKPGDDVICFANLPPLFSNRGNVFVFLQNRYLFGVHDFSGFPVGARLRLAIERVWFRYRMRSGYQIIVQSLSMQRDLRLSLGLDSLVLPFLPEAVSCRVTSNIEDKATMFDFVYVSSAEPHKNHENLLNAWVILAEQGIRPSLALTVSRDTAAHVANLIDQKKDKHGLKITNFGTLTPGDVLKLYSNSSALIFPSKLESFGLPLLEAGQLGLPILASELDYVRDVIDPVQTFDPHSPTSIARAVLRHLKLHLPKTETVDAKEFLARVQQQVKK